MSKTPPQLSHLSALPEDIIIQTENPSRTNNLLNFYLGLGIMSANKVRKVLKGYTSARGFDFEDIQRAIQYDFRVVKRWMDYLEVYEKGSSNWTAKNILELGPGADLGVGLISIAAGANSYHALDVHNLIKNTPKVFYEQLLKELEKDELLKTNINTLHQELEYTLKQKNHRLNYQCNPDFNLNIFKDKNINLIVSNAAFQQFDDPETTIRQLSQITSSGSLFIALIDLKTHTRWINKRDPLNIYRYPEKLYRFLKFRGAQNRIRPFEFKKMLEQNNWEDVQIIPRIQLSPSVVKHVQPSLEKRFRSSKNQMELLTFVLCARRK